MANVLLGSSPRWDLPLEYCAVGFKTPGELEHDLYEFK